jgi:hypothetical protein
MEFTFQNNIPDDIMIDILSLLTFEEYLKVRKTCNRIKLLDKEIKCCTYGCIKYDLARIGKFTKKYPKVRMNVAFFETTKINKMVKNLCMRQQYLDNIDGFNFFECKSLTDDGFNHLKDNLLSRKIKSVNLSGCNGVTHDAKKNLKYVSEINLDFNHLKDENIELLENVKILSVEFCTNLTNKSVTKILENVEKLNLKLCNRITDDIFVKQKNLQIKELCLSDCYKITDKSLKCFFLK